MGVHFTFVVKKQVIRYTNSKKRLFCYRRTYAGTYYISDGGFIRAGNWQFFGQFGRRGACGEQILLSLGNGLLQRLVDKGTKGYKGSSIACTCGSSQRFVNYRTKSIYTLFGWIPIILQQLYWPGRSELPQEGGEATASYDCDLTHKHLVLRSHHPKFIGITTYRKSAPFLNNPGLFG